MRRARLLIIWSRRFSFMAATSWRSGAREHGFAPWCSRRDRGSSAAPACWATGISRSAGPVIRHDRRNVVISAPSGTRVAGRRSARPPDREHARADASGRPPEQPVARSSDGAEAPRAPPQWRFGCSTRPLGSSRRARTAAGEHAPAAGSFRGPLTRPIFAGGRAPPRFFFAAGRRARARSRLGTLRPDRPGPSPDRRVGGARATAPGGPSTGTASARRRRPTYTLPPLRVPVDAGGFSASVHIASRRHWSRARSPAATFAERLPLPPPSRVR